MYACVCVYVCMYVYMHACIYAFMHVCIYVYMLVCMYVCIHACMYACTHACCMYICQWRRKVPKSVCVCVLGRWGGGAHRHVIYVPSVKNQYKRVVFGCMVI